MEFNLKCDNFRDNLFKLINQSELPLAVVYYIYKDVFYQMQKTYMAIINSETLKKQKQALKSLGSLKQNQGNNQNNQINNINDQDKDK